MVNTFCYPDLKHKANFNAGVFAFVVSFNSRFAPPRLVAPRLTGPGALDLYRVCQIADVLDVSADWLLGRSNVMDVAEPPKKKAKNTA